MVLRRPYCPASTRRSSSLERGQIGSHEVGQPRRRQRDEPPRGHRLRNPRSGRHPARPNRRVDTSISISFIAQRSSPSSCAAVSQLGIMTSRRPRPGPAGARRRSCRRGNRSVPLFGPNGAPAAPHRDRGAAPGCRHIRLHHRAERLASCRKAEPTEARSHFRKRFVPAPLAGQPAGVISLDIAFQGGQRRPLQKSNRTRGTSPRPIAEGGEYARA
ncbi:hypothetical protein ABIB90_007871 [Bradyrhizobium sp. JR4.1]